MAGLEALARWRHPDGRLVPARKFLPGVQRQGRGPCLDHHVLAEAAAQLRRWSDGGGAGRASLSHLRELPVDFLKVDPELFSGGRERAELVRGHAIGRPRPPEKIRLPSRGG